MKKHFLILFLILSIVPFLAGCGKARPERTSFSYTGVISQIGYYLTITTDDDNFKLRSTFLDLNPYLNKKVKIHGQFSNDVFFVDDVKPAQ